MDRELEVFVELRGTNFLVGRIWSRVIKGRESASFEYDQEWLKSDFRFPLAPLMSMDTGPHHTEAGKPLFGAIGDSAPDRWGRELMRRAERRDAERVKRDLRTLLEVDYLLMVDDALRQGALRFREPNSKEFLAHQEPRIPLLVELPRLLAASDHVLADTDTDEDLRLLMAPGSSLGGARPKAAVRDRDGSLAIAKFPHRGDDHNVELWSAVALSLARKAGIRVPAHRVVPIAKQPVLLVSRFDRYAGGRIPFLSAMSMLGAGDNEPHSYLELVDAIRQHGAEVKSDLRELWRRLLFNVLASNFDDHLRNHGFLYDEGKRGWSLSPAYDLNPLPIDLKSRNLSLLIDEQDNTASFELVIGVGEYFDLQNEEMKSIVAEVATAVSQWRIEAAELGISSSESNRMMTAFDHDELRKALQYAARTSTSSSAIDDPA
jgi:serine/threonine-protein kinase HipA